MAALSCGVRARGVMTVTPARAPGRGAARSGTPVAFPEGMTDRPDSRAQLLEEVSRRLRPVCLDIPADEFDALVARIVDAELSHRARASGTAPRAAMIDGS